MKFLALLVIFTLNLFGLGECISCHEEQAKVMTSACSSCHTQTLLHEKNKLQKTSPVTLRDFQNFSNDDKPILLSYQGLLQKEYASKEYFHMQSDVHFQKGMNCQDCHSSAELHNDDFWAFKRESEVKCQDCHGTTKSYPWELRLRGKELPRGTFEENNTTYLISYVGKPLANVQKKEKTVVVYLASGKELQLQPLKLLKKNKQLSQAAVIAMDNIKGHRKNLACASCHTLWAPQFYGSSVTTDLRKKTVAQQEKKGSLFTRWEEPFLAEAKDGKIVPAVPKTPLKTIEIEKNGNVVEHREANKLTPFIPHTIQKDSRSCESCHTSTKVLDGSVDFGSFKEKKLTHFNISKVLSTSHVDKLDRRGVCLSCHETIPDGNLAVSAIAHISEILELDANAKEHQMTLNTILNMSAWFQIVSVLFVIVIVMYIIYTTMIRKKSINSRNKGWK